MATIQPVDSYGKCFALFQMGTIMNETIVLDFGFRASDWTKFC
jgi:hypothetical protein